jgi:hypothetical protein
VPTHRTPGMTQLGVDILDELSDRLREYCARVGSTITIEVRLAIRRHPAVPPRDAVPPLPDAARPRGRPKKAAGSKGKK